MIEQVTFKNFKALRDVTLDLSPFTLIVGPNASGKTSVLEGLHHLTQLGTTPPESLFRDDLDPAVLRSSGATTLTLGFSGTWDGARGSLQVTAMPVGHGSGRKWDFTIIGQWQGARVDFERNIQQSPGRTPQHVYKGQNILRTAIRSAALLHLDPTRLERPSYTEGATVRVEYDGSNLASVLADMATAAPDEFQALQSRVKAVVPSVRSVRVPRTTIEDEAFERVKGQDLYSRVRTRNEGYHIVVDFAAGKGIVASHVSEGTMLTLGLLALVGGATHPRLVMIDELERGLHPKAIGELVRQIRELQVAFPDLQVIGTTHSPYLVDHFKPEEIRLTTLRDDGSVVAGTLNEHPDFDRWKDEMKPGEFWSNVGEDWLREKKGPSGG